jgi:perosamine synthetase
VHSPETGIPRFLPLAEPWLGADCADAVSEQILSSFIGPGAACRDFAHAIEAFLGIRGCVLTTSGTVALSVATVALGLKPGDEILIPAYGVISTINAFAALRLRPRLVDIDRRTACIDPNLIDRRITPETKAVCFVNFAGYTGANIVRVAEVAAAHGLPLIEDAACAFGHRHEGKAAGTFGTIGTLSFSVPKALTTGQGGAVLTNDPALAERAGAYIDQGDLHWRERNLNHGIGTNLRFNDVLASLGLAQMRSIEERLARKRRVFNVLHDMLGGRIYRVPGEQAPLHNVVLSSEPERLVAALREKKIGATRQYRSLYQHPPYAGLADVAFPNADFWTDHAVYLPFGVALTEEDAERIGCALTDNDVELLEI